MRVIIPGIATLLQYLNELRNDPERFRPLNCDLCGRCGLWRHGYYGRKSDRENNSANTLNSIPIPRFYCCDCKHTCSVLPECIPPRRWYLWSIQQAVLLLVLMGQSATAISQFHMPGRRTIGRWLQWLQERSDEFCFHLKSRDSKLGYYSNFTDFWSRCFEQWGLAKVMIFLNGQGLMVP